MSVVTNRRPGLEAGEDDRGRLLAELREVDHWRRLVSARLDLAVAAVTGLGEPVHRDLPWAPPMPEDLRSLVGLPDGGPDPGTDGVASMERLRAALDDLDCYALALRALTCR